MLLQEQQEEELRGIYTDMLDACRRIERVLHCMADLKELHARAGGSTRGPLDLSRHGDDQAEAA
jgi:hypothetical protein